MFAITLTTKIAVYIIRMEIRRRSVMADGSMTVVAFILRQKKKPAFVGTNERVNE